MNYLQQILKLLELEEMPFVLSFALTGYHSRATTCRLQQFTGNNVENLSQKTLVQKTKEKLLKTIAESCNDNSSNGSNRISSFTPIYHRIIKEVHKVIRNTLRVTLESSDTLKQILPVDSIKLSSRRDRNLKEISAPAVPHAHRQKERKRVHVLNAITSDVVM